MSDDRRKRKHGAAVVYMKWAIAPFLLILSVIAPLRVVRHTSDYRRVSENVEDGSEPSYVRMCNAILSNKATTVTEDPTVCSSSSDIHSSLLQIFASSLLASQIDKNSEIRYEHGCNNDDAEEETVQQFLPSKVLMPGSSMTLSAEEVCRRCTTPECILFPTEDEQERSTTLAAIASNIQFVLETYSRIKDLKLSDSNDSRAVVYLAGTTCPSHVKQLKHLKNYALSIPRTVSHIMVMVTDEFRTACSTNCDPDKETHCEYDLAAKKFIKDYFQQEVWVSNGESSIQQFLKVKQSRYFICPVGDHCLFPSLTSTHFVSLHGDTQNMLHWFQNWRNVAPVSQELHKSACRRLQGRRGSWVQDNEFAKSLQYQANTNHYFSWAQNNFQPTPQTPYRQPTTYKWQELYFPLCDYTLLTKDALCNTLSNLKLQRIMFVGDSLQFNMAYSFLKLIGGEDTIEHGQQVTFQCPFMDVDLMFIRNDQLIENDLPVDMSPSDPDKRQLNCHAFCYPWTETYRSSPKKTLLVLNTGAHYDTLYKFQRTVDNVFQTLDSIDRKDDIVVFRTTAPGHQHCDQYDKPFKSYQEYLHTNPTQDSFYSWDKFSTYNDYVSQVLEHRRRSSSINAQAHIELLDIFMMTVLRPDGHISGSECTGGECKQKGDCLHYSLPGALDWWNHLMLSNLISVAEEMKENEVTAIA